RILIGDDAPDHAGLLQYGQVPVGRTLHELAVCGQDLADRHGVTGPRHHVDKRAALRREPLTHGVQPAGDAGFDVRDHGGSAYQRRPGHLGLRTGDATRTTSAAVTTYSSTMA